MPQIRYTKGPETLSLGDIPLVINEWVDVNDDMAKQAALKERKAEYGFEVRTAKVESKQSDASAQTPAK
ncbi:hypothetical protein [Herbaspirillum sp. ST 5-3]|uniref:hypothetical protein n=1 Tax=Oxalobacteraceae TaxID=75682 RepID=UPI0010A59691|nr:hypothetical protein [Herbaspirillum sp. ST 5-3]